MTQTTAIHSYLKRHKKAGITSFEAWAKLGVSRLASRILDLRNMGIEITRELVMVQNREGDMVRVARYRIG